MDDPADFSDNAEVVYTHSEVERYVEQLHRSGAFLIDVCSNGRIEVEQGLAGGANLAAVRVTTPGRPHDLGPAAGSSGSWDTHGDGDGCCCVHCGPCRETSRPTGSDLARRTAGRTSSPGAAVQAHRSHKSKWRYEPCAA